MGSFLWVADPRWDQESTRANLAPLVYAHPKFRYRSIEDALPADVISEMHLKRLDSVDVRVTDEEADCRRVYSNHFKHKAEQRGQSERRVAHEMRKKLFHDVRCGFLHTKEELACLKFII